LTDIPQINNASTDFAAVWRADQHFNITSCHVPVAGSVIKFPGANLAFWSWHAFMPPQVLV
jgi:hypothetical protein